MMLFWKFFVGFAGEAPSYETSGDINDFKYSSGRSAHNHVPSKSFQMLQKQYSDEKGSFIFD